MKSITGSVSCGAARNLITLPDCLFIYHVLATAFKYFCFLFKQNWNINWYSSWCYSREGIQGPVAIKTLFQIFPFSTDDSFESCTGNSLEILFCIWIFFQVRIGCPFNINGWSCLHRLNVIILKTKLGVVMFCKKSKMGLHLVFELFYHRYTHVTVPELNWALGLGLEEAGRESPKGSCSCRWHPQDI